MKPKPTVNRSLQLGFEAANRSQEGILFYISIFLLVVILPLPLNALFHLTEISTRDLLRVINTLSPSLVRTDQLIFAPANLELDAASLIVARGAFIDQLREMWPISLLYLFLLAGVSIWLYGGQIGYLSRQLREGRSEICEFWKSANPVFFSLFFILIFLGAVYLTLMRLLAPYLAVLGPAEAIFIFFAEAVIGIALMLWLIIVVVEKVSAIEALKRGGIFFKRHGLKYVAICLILGLVSVLLRLVFGYVDYSNPAKMPSLLAASMFLHKLTYFYLQFIFTAELIQYYFDAKEDS